MVPVVDSAFTPFTVGVYRCTQRLSAGRSGELFAAIHRPTGTLRAIRRLSPDILADRTLARGVLQNLERIRQLKHPNVLRIHETIVEIDEAYVVMDYIQGVNLMDVLKRLRGTAPLSPQLATFITSQICQALDHAHHFREEGRPSPLVHGALWPPNVLLSFRGEITVSDFGAWVIPTGLHGEEGNVSIRTQFSYRSPEHVNGSTLTSASDVFCVGILLFELLTGRQLFLGQSLMETLELVENAEVESLAGVPDPLLPVLGRCLEREPSGRYADPASLFSELSVAFPRSGSREVRSELARFLDGFPRPSGGPGPLAPEPILQKAHSAEVDTEEGATRRSNLPPVPPPDDLTPEPVAPLTPLPGLREDIDEPTNINPTGVTEALVALSKDTTDPGALDSLFGPEPGEEEEPTRIDPIIPGITGPEPLPALGKEDADHEEGPTNIPGVDQRVLWESPDEVTVPTDDDTRPQPVFPPLPPGDRGKFIKTTSEADEDEESTVKTSGVSTALSGEFSVDDEPTIQASHAPLDSITPPPQTVGSRGDLDDEPTFPSKPDGKVPSTRPPQATPGLGWSPAPSAPPKADEGDDEPTLQASQPQLSAPGSKAPPAAQPPGVHKTTLPWGALENVYPAVGDAGRNRDTGPAREVIEPRREEGTPAVEALAKTALAGDEAIGDPGGLEFSFAPGDEGKPAPAQLSTYGQDDSSLVSDVSTFDRERRAVAQEISEVSDVSSFDQDSFVSGVHSFEGDSSVFSVSMPGPARSRFTAAHVLLLVAIVVFLIAVGLLIRRLVLQSRAHRAQSTVEQVVDAAVVTPRTSSLSPDAGPRKQPKPTPKTGKPKGKVHSSGQHLNALLHGKLKPGMLRIVSKPPGMVYVNGKRLGDSPVTARVRPGDQVKLAVVAPRFELHHDTVDVPLSRGMSLEVTLREAGYKRAEGRRRGWLAVHCRKRDERRIMLDGQDTGYSCPGPVVFRISPGRHKVGFFSPATGKISGRRAKVRSGRKAHIWAPR